MPSPDQQISNVDMFAAHSLLVKLMCSPPSLQAWSAMSQVERGDKERFYQGQQGTARGFMSYAITTMTLLTTLTGDDVVVRHRVPVPQQGGL